MLGRSSFTHWLILSSHTHGFLSPWASSSEHLVGFAYPIYTDEETQVWRNRMSSEDHTQKTNISPSLILSHFTFSRGPYSLQGHRVCHDLSPADLRGSLSPRSDSCALVSAHALRMESPPCPPPLVPLGSVLRLCRPGLPHCGGWVDVPLRQLCSL